MLHTEQTFMETSSCFYKLLRKLRKYSTSQYKPNEIKISLLSCSKFHKFNKQIYFWKANYLNKFIQWQYMKWTYFWHSIIYFRKNGNTPSIFKHIYMLKPINKYPTRSKIFLSKPLYKKKFKLRYCVLHLWNNFIDLNNNLLEAVITRIHWLDWWIVRKQPNFDDFKVKYLQIANFLWKFQIFILIEGHI